MSLRTFPYVADHFDFPALILEVRLAHPNPEDKRDVKINAKVDTGADGSVIPVNLRNEWNLNQTGEITTIDFRGEKKKQPTYDVRIVIDGLFSKIVEVIATNRENVLLGRDILNDLKMCANGKSQLFTLEDP